MKTAVFLLCLAGCAAATPVMKNCQKLSNGTIQCQLTGKTPDYELNCGDQGCELNFPGYFINNQFTTPTLSTVKDPNAPTATFFLNAGSNNTEMLSLILLSKSINEENFKATVLLVNSWLLRNWGKFEGPPQG